MRHSVDIHYVLWNNIRTFRNLIHGSFIKIAHFLFSHASYSFNSEILNELFQQTIFNHFWEFNLLCNVMNEKWDLQCPQLKMHDRISRTVSFLTLCLKFSGYPSLQGESMGILCLFDNLLLASHKSCGQSSAYNFNAKLNGRNVWLNV